VRYVHVRLAFGNECGIAIIDIVQKTCLLSMGTPDLYGKSSTVFYVAVNMM